jgi:hypothetical protein
MNLVKLTRPDGKALHVSPEQVCCVELSTSQYDEQFTMITFVSGQFKPVTETVSQVVALLESRNEAQEDNNSQQARLTPYTPTR